MRLSESARNNGWKDLPAEDWNRERPQNRVRDLPFWEFYAKKYGDPILDLACGNGRWSLALSRKGYDVVGIDINAGLIETAKQAAPPDLSLELIVGDIVNFTIEKEFGFAMLPDWSFQVLLTQEDQISFLQSVHRHLKPGGGFALNMFQAFWALLKARPHDKHPHLMSIGSEPPYGVFDPVRQIRYDPEGTEYPRPTRHTTLREFNLLFQLTGFKIVELFGDVDKRPFQGLGEGAAERDDYTIVAEKLQGSS